jgi:NAD(P)-dependent dehydrogenase (short-subunit alcohol dehydrogenase family)
VTRSTRRGREATPAPVTFAVTGANRGIGLELARQLSARGDSVIATARRPDRAEELRALDVRIESLDVADPGSVAQFAERLGDTPVDALIHNAGIGEAGPGFEELSMEDLERSFRVNALGAARLSQALLPNLRRGRRKLIAGLSSGLASLERNRDGGWIAYRVSKAALNMLLRTMAAELRREGFLCVLIDPGWVRTDMGGPSAPTPVDRSVARILQVLDGLTPGDTGRFFDSRGRDAVW